MYRKTFHNAILAYSSESMVVPDKPLFLQLTAGEKRMPVYRDLLADVETPLSAYWKLAHDQTYSFLLESVTGGEQLARYSLLGIKPKAVLRTKNDRSSVETVQGKVETKLKPGQDPLDLLGEHLAGKDVVTVADLPAFVGGSVGMLSYDIVRFFEKLPDGCLDDLQVDDLAMMLTDSVVVFDHAKNIIRVIAMADGTSEGYDQAASEIDSIIRTLQGPLPPLPTDKHEPHEVKSNVEKTYFEDMVRRMVEYISQGDGLQMVPAQRFETKVEAHPVTIYRALRSLNPSPYMFILRFGDFDLVGASPELQVSLHGGKARVRPIAGTRWRGKTPEEDKALEVELLADEKERAEHIMLVDLGRNDLGRVCEYGSVKVNELMVIERYSHVMHIVSDVTGTLAKDKDMFDLFRACHPLGTVSGAPKVRAMEIIDELEPTRRGAYAGAAGFFSVSGDIDTCVLLRTIYLKDGKAYVQAGGGVVYDSVPENEYVESCNKAKASLRAIEIAQRGL
jgi:anthranilate synthase component I